MATFLLELFSEEIPSRMQRGAAEQLQRLIASGFEKNMLQPTATKTFVSPRHLAIQCEGLPLIQPDTREEKRGPKLGAPAQALSGFLTASGLTLEQCEQRDGYYYATIERKGRPVAQVVREVVEAALAAFSWPKSMRWGSRPLVWVRPLHRIACLLDEAVIPVQFAHLTGSNITQGHRFLSPAEITIPHAAQYESLLASAHVIVDYTARRAKIAAAIAALASAAKLSVVTDEALLDEVTGLVEWPVPLLGMFDAAFLTLPPEVLISEMKVHQRYFALNDASGALTNQFIAVANMVTADGGKAVIAGNARVLRARLSDGAFYWEQDRKKSLRDWADGLKDVVFHAKVGMMDEKVARIETLALTLAKAVGFTDTASVTRAAQLCKADLTSGMVGEFPDLQGIMGRYYATAQGESAAVADAIRDHYKPVGANDSVPESPLAAIIAIADKLDAIISLFAAGEKPTGSKDPLALRRAALGVLRILNHHQWSLDIASLDSRVTADVSEFFRDRLQNLLREEGLRADVVDAYLSTAEHGFNPLAIATRARTLAEWLATSAGKESLAAIKRASNILAAEEKKAKKSFDPSTAASLPKPADQKLIAALQQPITTPKGLESLTAPINQFFTDILVTEPDFRNARLGLLAQVRATAATIADFSKIEG
ncbi:MAG: glycine--tRNA ligase subunit beta [Pseudomonadota bacterium]